MESINNNNYELWLVRYADGDLTAAERKAVEQWLEGHPEAAEELKLYGEAPRLERDEEVRFASTESQHSATVRPLWSTGWRWAAAAAVALLLLTPAVLHFVRPQATPVQVASVEQGGANMLPAVVDTAEAPAAAVRPVRTVGTRRAASAAYDVAETLAEATEMPLADTILPVPTNATDLLAEATEMLAADTARRVPTEAVAPEELVAEEPQMVYVDNLFVEEPLEGWEQDLLAVNDAAKDRLQGTYLGRRLARRLPDDDRLLAMADEARERTPRGLRMVADLIRTYNESNK